MRIIQVYEYFTKEIPAGFGVQPYKIACTERQNYCLPRDILSWGKWQFEEELKKDHLNEIEQIRNKNRDIDKDFERPR